MNLGPKQTKCIRKLPTFPFNSHRSPRPLQVCSRNLNSTLPRRINLPLFEISQVDKEAPSVRCDEAAQSRWINTPFIKASVHDLVDKALNYVFSRDREPARAEGVIPHSNPGWSNDGAAHRVNCDTPPLKGNCLDTLGSNWKRARNPRLA